MKTVLEVSANAAPVDYVGAGKCFGDKKGVFYAKVKGIKKQIEKGRYDSYAVIEYDRIMVNYFVYYDYTKYGKRLEDEFECKRVPPFDIRRIAKMTPTMVERCFYEEEGE